MVTKTNMIMKNRKNVLVNVNTPPPIGASLTPSRTEPVKLDSDINLKSFIVQSSPILCQYSNHIFGCKLNLNHHLGDVNSLHNTITKKIT